MPYAPLNLYDATIPSDGLTVDTPAGPVDLIAVGRRLRGVPDVVLTMAEKVYVTEVTEGRLRYGKSIPHPAPAPSAAGYLRLAQDIARGGPRTHADAA